jgi:hypothetical protein
MRVAGRRGAVAAGTAGTTATARIAATAARRAATRAAASATAAGAAMGLGLAQLHQDGRRVGRRETEAKARQGLAPVQGSRLFV